MSDTHGLSWEQVDGLISQTHREYPRDSTAASLAEATSRLRTELTGAIRLLHRTYGPGLPLADLADEIARQDRFHPSGYPATRDGVFLGITTAVHELDREAIDAWRSDRCRCETPLCGHADWGTTRGEMLQAAAIIMRTIRSIDDTTSRPRTAEKPVDDQPIVNTDPPSVRCRMCGRRARWDGPRWITCRRCCWSSSDPRRTGIWWHIRVWIGR